MPDPDKPAKPKTPPKGPGQDKDKQKTATMFGATLNFENTRKYSFDASGTTKIHAKLVAVPAPSAFLDAIAEHTRKS